MQAEDWHADRFERDWYFQMTRDPFMILSIFERARARATILLPLFFSFFQRCSSPRTTIR